MRMDVVIVNYRTAGMTVDCLRSLAAEVEDRAGGGAGVSARVWVVDNQSGDGSAERIRAAVGAEGMDGWVRVIEAGRNGGFAAGNNAAVGPALRDEAGWGVPDAILLLNPDTIVRPGALGELAKFLRKHPKAGICGCRVEDADGTAQQGAHPFPSPLTELARGALIGVITRRVLHAVDCGRLTEPTRFDWVTGAAFCVRREVFEQIGVMDEGFFLYFEEVDFCKRAASAGWEVWHLPASRIVHLEGSATGIGQASKRRPRYWFESRRRFFIKHYGVAGLVAADALWAAGRVMFGAARLLRLCPRATGVPKRYGADLLLGDLGAIVRGRARGGGTEGAAA